MRKLLYLLLPAALLASCSDEPATEPAAPPAPVPEELADRLIICNEGNWQSDNGQLTYYNTGTGQLVNEWFRSVNHTKIGDTPNDIIQVNDTLVAIAVNWSNIIQYIHPDGTACGATENVPNNRRLCSDGRYLYVTSYAHICGNETFTKGYVAKIDVATKQVVATCETGWEPEAVKIYNGRLYVANTGDYAFSEGHDYESTIQVIDAASMTTLKTIDTGCINLHSTMSQAGRYLCVNSCGDYFDAPAATVVIDCETDTFRTYPFPASYNATDGTLFYTIGVAFSYITGENTYHLHTIDPATGQVTDGIIAPAITEALRGLEAPYALYISPYTGNVYFTDARSFASAGYLYGYTPAGEALFPKQKLYINPGSILALKP